MTCMCGSSLWPLWHAPHASPSAGGKDATRVTSLPALSQRGRCNAPAAAGLPRARRRGEPGSASSSLPLSASASRAGRHLIRTSPAPSALGAPGQGGRRARGHIAGQPCTPGRPRQRSPGDKQAALRIHDNCKNVCHRLPVPVACTGILQDLLWTGRSGLRSRRTTPRVSTICAFLSASRVQFSNRHCHARSISCPVYQGTGGASSCWVGQRGVYRVCNRGAHLRIRRRRRTPPSPPHPSARTFTDYVPTGTLGRKWPSGRRLTCRPSLQGALQGAAITRDESYTVCAASHAAQHTAT